MKINDFAKITTGIHAKPSLEGSVYLLQARDYNKSFELRTDLEPTLAPTKTIAKHTLIVGDVLVTARGQYFQAFPFKGEVVPAVPSSTFLVLRILDRSLVVPEYLAWYINHPKSQHYLNAQARGSSIRAINKKTLGNIDVPILPIERQQSIFELMRLVQKEKKIQAEINRLKTAIINQQLLNLLDNEAQG